MIKDLDDTIRQLILERAGFSPNDVEISFNQPTANWQAGLTRPTITCYLYNVEENLNLRDTAQDFDRKYHEGIVIRGSRPMRIDLTYFITTWTTEVEDEHEILWRILGVLANGNPLPEELLQGRLTDQPFPIPTKAAHRPEAVSNLTDVWNVMDNQFRPAINYTVTLALERPLKTSIPMVFAKRLKFHNVPKTQQYENLTQIGGIAYEKRTRQPIVGAQVIHVERGTQVETDEFGRYSLGGLEDGKHRLRLIVNGSESEHEITVDPSTDRQRFDLPNPS